MLAIDLQLWDSLISQTYIFVLITAVRFRVTNMYIKQSINSDLQQRSATENDLHSE